MFRFTIFFVFCGTVSGIGDYNYPQKHFLPNTDLLDPSHWDTMTLPCSKKSVFISENLEIPHPFASFLNGDMKAANVILPMKGEVILAVNDSSIIMFNSLGNTDHCIAGEIHFKGNVPRDWYSPRNWCTQTERGGACVSKVTDELPSCLDTEQVPCSRDTVVFSPQSAYMVNLEQVNQTLNAVYFGGQIIRSTADFNYLVETSSQFMTQSRDFTFNSGISVGGGWCDLAVTPGGCPCGNDMEEIQTLICKEEKICPFATCKAPISVPGHCCGICGGVLSMGLSANGKIRDIKDFTDDFVRNENKENIVQVKSIVSRASDGRLRLILMDIGSDIGQRSSELTQRLYSDLQKEHYAVFDVRMEISGHDPNALPNHAGKLSAMIIGILVAILVVVAIIVIYIRKRRRSPFPNTMTSFGDGVFVREVRNLPYRARNVFRRIRTSPTIEMDRVAYSQEVGFDNPMFTAADATSHIEVMDFNPAPGSFKNPLYESSNKKL